MIRKLGLAAVLALVWLVRGDQTPHSVRADDMDKKPAAAPSAPYVHAVVFTLKKDAPAGAAEGMITDAHELLAKIPSVRLLRTGRPAEKDSKDFVKKDYDVGLMILFDDIDGLKTYIDHPLHLKYVERNLKHLDTDKLVVYDFSNQKK